MRRNRLAQKHPQASSLLAGGILIAGVTMMVRVVALAGALNPTLIAGLAAPLGAAAVILAAASAVLLLRHRNSKPERPTLSLKNPFDLATAMKLAALIAIVMVMAKVLSAHVGAQGLFLLAAVSGIADVDALTLSMSRLGGGQIALTEAVTAILIAASVNTAAKAALATYAGGRKIGGTVGAVSALAIVTLVTVCAFAPR